MPFFFRLQQEMRYRCWAWRLAHHRLWATDPYPRAWQWRMAGWALVGLGWGALAFGAAGLWVKHWAHLEVLLVPHGMLHQTRFDHPWCLLAGLMAAMPGVAGGLRGCKTRMLALHERARAHWGEGPYRLLGPATAQAWLNLLETGQAHALVVHASAHWFSQGVVLRERDYQLICQAHAALRGGSNG